ncbi:hypothetical protein [Actinomycetospora straminea]|uniref:Uncharacterized protein n=1 Tax=Actinomycetospora straminea TaxID=663607 RepID=A0ABP9F6C1_9PSEU|nr:hypothetical protein [Actinomycetospora straminea]MDD7936196.1 hypothetical protein [Actinomycetospora straminea]
MTTTPDDTHAEGDPDAGDARAPLHLEATYDDPALTVFRTAEWIPPAYRQAYLDGAASVLGREAFSDS